jgi:large subunit ribosomal protein L4
MISAKRFTNQGEERGTADLPEGLFGAAVNEHVLWLSVRTYLTNQRQGTASVRSRSFVSGGGAKPWRQKGTGRARAGSTRSPIWVHGARAHGPKPTEHRIRIPRKVRAIAMRSALSLAAQEGRVVVLDDPKLDRPRTRELAALLDRMGAAQAKCLMVLGEKNDTVALSGRNIPRLRTIPLSELNPYVLLDAERVIITESALKGLKEAAER